MKRYPKLIALLTALSLLLLTLAGCAPESSSSNDGDGEKTYKVAMVLESSINDGGWGTSCYQGMLTAAEERGWETAYTENVEDADFVSAFTEYANLGFDLIIAPGNQYQDAVLEAAANFPNVSFAVLNGTVTAENVSSISPDNTVVGFLAGMLAGLKTQTNSIAALASNEITSALQYIDGYEQGAAYVNPDVTVEKAWTNSFNDAAKGKELALSLITTNNVDVIFGLASGCDVGMREACQESENVYSIAQPSLSLMEQAPDIILSVIVADTPALFGIAMEQVESGSFGNENYIGGLDEGVVYIGEMGESAADIEEEYLALVEQLKAGEIEFEYNIT